jgi:hypothetical protein
MTLRRSISRWMRRKKRLSQFHTRCLSVALFLSTGKGIVEALGPVLDLLDESPDEVLLLDGTVSMR